MRKFETIHWNDLQWGGNHYAGILASKKLDHDSEAEKLLKDWQNAQPHSPLVEWATDDFYGSSQHVGQIVKENTDVAISFLLLKKAIYATRIEN